MRTIPLTNSTLVALVDDEDYDRVMQYKWSLSSGSCTSKHTNHVGIRYTIHLHRVVMNCEIIKDRRIIDHVNGNILDNQKLNLRFCTRSQNSINRKSSSKYGFRGITYCNKVKAFYARIKVDKKRIGLGKFDTAVDAAKAYNTAAIKYHKEFAQLNVF